LVGLVYEKDPENSESFADGGGENRTLVLGKRHMNDYMLIVLSIQTVPMLDAPLGLQRFSMVSNYAPKKRRGV